MHKRNLSTNFVGLILLFALSLGLLAQASLTQSVEARTNPAILEATAEATTKTEATAEAARETIADTTPEGTQPNILIVVLTALIAGAAGYFWGRQPRGDGAAKSTTNIPEASNKVVMIPEKQIDNSPVSVVPPPKSKLVSPPTLNAEEQEQLKLLYELYRECQGIEGRIRVPNRPNN